MTPYEEKQKRFVDHMISGFATALLQIHVGNDRKILGLTPDHKTATIQDKDGKIDVVQVTKLFKE